MMKLDIRPDEHYVDGKDKWSVYYLTSDETRVNLGDYKETIRIVKNGELVGQTIWHKDENGNNRTRPYEYGTQHIPATAQPLTK
jgi:hypothetical protein